ncbi:hypothetical protein GCM10009819_32000 [Agromyces tropicus]|uniref:Uncharacterized protein n=1 Tax=Agromyces tropicus TaxID=555371 RepID=A0ABP5GEU8_9MICO
MSNADAPPAATRTDAGPVRPRAVTVAFWLWWPQLVFQAQVVANLALGTVLAAFIGGPAWDILIYAVPIGIPLAVVTVLEARQLFRLRGGSRRARVILAVLAAVAVVCMIGYDLSLVQVYSPGSGTIASQQGGLASLAPVIARDAVVVAATVTATVLTFTPSATAFFARDRGADGRD